MSGIGDVTSTNNRCDDDSVAGIGVFPDIGRAYLGLADTSSSVATSPTRAGTAGNFSSAGLAHLTRRASVTDSRRLVRTTGQALALEALASHTSSKASPLKPASRASRRLRGGRLILDTATPVFSTPDSIRRGSASLGGRCRKTCSGAEAMRRSRGRSTGWCGAIPPASNRRSRLRRWRSI